MPHSLQYYCSVAQMRCGMSANGHVHEHRITSLQSQSQCHLRALHLNCLSEMSLHDSDDFFQKSVVSWADELS